MNLLQFSSCLHVKREEGESVHVNARRFRHPSLEEAVVEQKNAWEFCSANVSFKIHTTEVLFHFNRLLFL